MMKLVTAIANQISLAGFKLAETKDSSSDDGSFNIFRPGDGARHFRHGLRAEGDQRAEGRKVTIN